MTKKLKPQPVKVVFIHNPSMILDSNDIDLAFTHIGYGRPFEWLKSKSSKQTNTICFGVSYGGSSKLGVSKQEFYAHAIHLNGLKISMQQTNYSGVYHYEDENVMSNIILNSRDGEVKFIFKTNPDQLFHVLIL